MNGFPVLLSIFSNSLLDNGIRKWCVIKMQVNWWEEPVMKKELKRRFENSYRLFRVIGPSFLYTIRSGNDLFLDLVSLDHAVTVAVTFNIYVAFRMQRRKGQFAGKADPHDGTAASSSSDPAQSSNNEALRETKYLALSLSLSLVILSQGCWLF